MKLTGSISDQKGHGIRSARQTNTYKLVKIKAGTWLKNRSSSGLCDSTRAVERFKFSITCAAIEAALIVLPSHIEFVELILVFKTEV